MWDDIKPPPGRRWTDNGDRGSTHSTTAARPKGRERQTWADDRRWARPSPLGPLLSHSPHRSRSGTRGRPDPRRLRSQGRWRRVDDPANPWWYFVADAKQRQQAEWGSLLHSQCSAGDTARVSLRAADTTWCLKRPSARSLQTPGYLAAAKGRRRNLGERTDATSPGRPRPRAGDHIEESAGAQEARTADHLLQSRLPRSPHLVKAIRRETRH